MDYPPAYSVAGELYYVGNHLAKIKGLFEVKDRM
jgi:hypothetical protein